MGGGQCKRMPDGKVSFAYSCFMGLDMDKVKCVDCGSWFGSKVWHSTDQYRKVIYRCSRKYSGGKCGTPHVTEDEVKEDFVPAYNQLITEKKEITVTFRDGAEIQA